MVEKKRELFEQLSMEIFTSQKQEGEPNEKIESKNLAKPLGEEK